MRQDPADSPSWLLFADWCAATGRPPLTVTWDQLLEFRQAAPCGEETWNRRIKTIRAMCRQVGTSPPEPVRAAPADWWTDVLATAVVRSWPAGIVGRRDSFLAVLAGPLQMQRSQILALQGTSVVPASTPPRIMLDGRIITIAGSPGSCLACGVTRWLRVLAIAQRQGWAHVRRLMSGDWPDTAGQQAGHDCARPIHGPFQEMPLLPAIDRWGSVAFSGELSGRSVFGILAARRQPSAPIMEPMGGVAEPDRDFQPWDRRKQHEALVPLVDALDRLEVLTQRALEASAAALV